MPSLLDRFVIDIALDTKKVAKGAKDAQVSLKGLNDAAQKSGTALADSGKAMADGFSKARNEALALMAVFTGGRSLKAFTSEVTRTNNALANTAQRLDVSPQRLAQLQNMLKATGGDPGEAEGLISSLQQRMMDPQQMATLNKVFSQLHMPDWVERMKDPVDFIKALNQGTQGMPQQLKNNLLQQVGVGNGEITLIDKTTQALNDLDDQYKDLGPTSEQLRHSQQLFEDWQHLTMQSEALGRALLDDVTPGLDAVIREFDALEKGHLQAIENIMQLAAALTALGAAGKAAKVAQVVMEALGLTSAAEMTGLAATGATAVALPALAGAEGIHLLRQNKDGRVARWLIDHAPDVQQANNVRALLGEKTEDDPSFNKFEQAVSAKEGARYDRMGGYHNAYAGRYQMGRAAIESVAKRLGEPVPTQEQFLSAPGMQLRYFRAFTQSNNDYLMKNSEQYRGLDVPHRWAALGYAQNQGAAGAAQWLKTGFGRNDGFGTAGSSFADAVADQMKISHIRPETTNTVHVGEVHIHTNATDAQGIARDIHTALATPSQLAHGNARGLQ